MNTPRTDTPSRGPIAQELPQAVEIAGESGGESFAPSADGDGAYQNGPQTVPTTPEGGQTPGKYRFMTALLDKLNVGGKRHARDAENVSAADRSDHSLLDTPGSDAADTPAGPREHVLEETQVGSVPAPRPMTFTYPPGSTPRSPYTIRRGIGVGGFGEVYFAVSQAGKEVALKRIQRNLEVELRGVSHCLNLKHPNLVSLFDICQDEDSQSWVVMEYVAGANLREVLDESPDGLPEAEVRRWFAGIAAGVNHLHSAGLVHRDLKPGNVFDDL